MYRYIYLYIIIYIYNRARVRAYACVYVRASMSYHRLTNLALTDISLPFLSY